VIATLSLLGITACSTADAHPTALAPIATPEVRTTSSPTATPVSPSVPALAPPAEALATAESASEFVQYYFDAVEHAYITGDVGVLQLISDDRCRPCEMTAQVITQAYEQGHRFEGVESRLREAETPQGNLAKAAEVFVIYSAEEIRRLDESQEVIATIAPVENQRLRFDLVNDADSWKLRNIAELDD
jgi:hypothetical protein